MALPYFTFNGRSSTTMGVIVRSYPPITRPPERVQTVSIPGRSGQLHIRENDFPVYEEYLRTMDCYIRPGANIQAICGWLTGSGALVCGNEPNRQYTAWVNAQIDFEKILRGHDHRSFLIPFQCGPYKKIIPETAAFALSKGQVVANPGNTAAQPLVRVTGSGDGTVNIGGRVMTLHLPNSSTTILIDCEAMTVVTSGGAAASQYLDGDFGFIPTGSTAMTWTGGVTAVTLTPRWRDV